MKQRQDQLRARMQHDGLHGALLTSAVAIRYYTGFTGGEGYALLTEESCSLITDFRYGIQAREQVQDCAKIVEVNQHAAQLAALRELLRSHRCTNCGYEDGTVSVADFTELSALDKTVVWTGYDEAIHAPRRIKSEDEIASLQKAQDMADRAYAKLLRQIKPGMTEREVAARLDYLCAMEGSEGPSFDTIVAAGPNGAMCHAVPGQRRLGAGDLVVVDFGCTADGYHSDMTRTFGVEGVEGELAAIYRIVLEAQRQSLLQVRAGITGAALDAIARDYITARGYGACFGHGLGHGFGLEIHEFPRAGQASADVLEAGMTVTIEPGIYLEGKGGVRIEDCVVVTDLGCRNLVSSAKDLLFI